MAVGREWRMGAAKNARLDCSVKSSDFPNVWLTEQKRLSANTASRDMPDSPIAPPFVDQIVTLRMSFVRCQATGSDYGV